ncbi:MAG: M91 family zinc metallopeptidase [Alphaproteobacteria bacterium]
MPATMHDTGFEHIKVRVDTDQSPMFPTMVKEALTTIYSKPVGKSLLDKIKAEGQAKFGYKVCIMRPDMTVQEVKGVTMIGGGNLAKRGNEDDACNGNGCVSMVKYNHNTINTPDGVRPNFIGLAHELVHAWHNLNGVAKTERMDEEHFTVGLNGYANVAICENSIRAEHNVPLRAFYSDD